jgi:hypothetical protein
MTPKRSSHGYRGHDDLPGMRARIRPEAPLVVAASTVVFGVVPAADGTGAT